MEMGLGKINGFENVHMQLSRYESGSYKAEVYSREDRLLLAFTEEGDAEDGTAPMYVRKSRYSEMILGKLMAAGIIFGYAGREGGFVAAVSPAAVNDGGSRCVPCQPLIGQASQHSKKTRAHVILVGRDSIKSRRRFMFFRSDRIRSMSESKLSMKFEADTRYDIMFRGTPVFTGKLVDIRGSKAYFQSDGMEKIIDFKEDVGYTFRKVLPFYIG